MRRFLLALIVLACAMPAAEAARRDDNGRTIANRSAQQQTAKAQPARSSSTREAASRSTSRQQASSRSTSRSSARETSGRNARQSVALRPGDARTTRGGVVVRGASAAAVPRNAAQSCTRRNGRTTCTAPRSSIAGWQSGLPTANYAQRECPAGTFATLARGHDDVVRCMPF